MRTIQADIKVVIKSNEATFQHIRTEKAIAGFLKKPLHGEKFRELKTKALGGGALDTRLQKIDSH